MSLSLSFFAIIRKTFVTYCCSQTRFKLFKSKSFEKAGRGRILSKEGRAGFGEETIGDGASEEY